MTEFNSFLETIWDQILSRDGEKIQSAFDSLDQSSQETVLSHLHIMTSEAGWHPEQVKSAMTALAVLENEN